MIQFCLSPRLKTKLHGVDRGSVKPVKEAQRAEPRDNPAAEQ